jgi:hypothetical protein
VYAIGDRVTQQQYGDGTITTANDRHTVIDFDEHGLRTFVTSLVHLERSSTAAPAKPQRAKRKTAVRKPKA